MQNCPNCNSAIKDKLFSSNQLISPAKTKLINTFTDKNAEAYCGKCVEDSMTSAEKNIRAMKKEIEQSFRDYVFSFPVISIENPKGWDYKVIQLMSQSISVGDSVHDKKMAERLCTEKLQTMLFKTGGNAIIGTRINYDLSKQTQTFSNRILSVYGTAVKVTNADSVFLESHHIAAAKYFGFDDSRRLLKSFDLL